MRFAVLTAVSALALSAPANAATWVFDVTGTFNVQIWEYLTVYNPQLGFNTVQTTSTTGPFQKTVRFSINSTGSGSAITALSSMAGVSFDTSRSTITLDYQIVNRQPVFSNFSFYGDTGHGRNCAPGPVGCYQNIGFGSAQSISYAFVSSSDATGPIPEPATWAMMIGGFGVMGVAMRRRRVSFA